MRRFGWLLAALLLSLGSARADNVLRVVPQSDLRVLDPHATAATITRIHAMMIYDQLYALDEKLEPHPQMVGRETVSDDKLTYEFTLRPGLVWDNGQKVTTADVLASLPRAAKQDALMQVMMKRVAALEAVDGNTFRIRLSKPFPLMEAALAANGATILRAEDIAAAGSGVLSTTTGCGPFASSAPNTCRGPRSSTSATRTTCPATSRPTGSRAASACSWTGSSGWSSRTCRRGSRRSRRARST